MSEAATKSAALPASKTIKGRAHSVRGAKMLHAVVHDGVGLDYTVIITGTVPNERFLYTQVLRTGFDPGENDLLAVCGPVYEMGRLIGSSSQVRSLFSSPSGRSIGILYRETMLAENPRLFDVDFKDLNYAAVLDDLLAPKGA
jgi:hypothetical protein